MDLESDSHLLVHHVQVRPLPWVELGERAGRGHAGENEECGGEHHFVWCLVFRGGEITVPYCNMLG